MSVSESGFGATIGALSNSRSQHPQELIGRLEREVTKAVKKLKQTNRYNQTLRDQKINERSSAETGELLDLKSELYSLKNKLVLQDQKRNQEVSQKNIQISTLEKKLKEAQAQRLLEATKKQQEIEELEKDIEITL
jgi:hypothetical protein